MNVDTSKYTHGSCRQCGKPVPGAGWVTCGNSKCQEQETKDNAARARAKRRSRR